MTDIVQMSKDGKKFYPQTHVQAVIGLQDSLVGTNLLTNSNFSSGLDHWIVNMGDNADCKAVVTTDSDGDTCVHITGTGGSSGIWQTTVKLGQNQIITGSVLAKGIGKLSRAGFSSAKNSNFGTVSTESYSKIGTTSQTVSDTNTFCIYFNPFNGVVDVYVKFAKLEKGPTATDYSLNPLDVATDGSVKTAITNALGKVATINVISQADYDALADKSGIYFIKGGD